MGSGICGGQGRVGGHGSNCWIAGSIGGHGGGMQGGLHNGRHHILNDWSAVHLGHTLVGDGGGHALHHGADLGQGGLLDDGSGCAVDQWCGGQMTGASGSDGEQSGENELLKTKQDN